MKSIEDDFDENEMFGNVAKAAPPPVASGNPLAAYFRVPGLSVPLPTGGRYFPPGAIELDIKGEIAVYPMRAADELLLKAPDALMSGLAVEKLIESCVPGIKTPRLISAPDLDVLLLAIRAASYGNMMPLEIVCPKCEHEMAFDCDLQSVLATMTEVPESLDLRLSADVVAEFRPHTLAAQTKLLIAAYEEQRHAMSADQVEDEEARLALLSGTLTKITQFQNTSIANAITQVTVPGAMVKDRNNILEFVTNAPREWQDAMQAQVEKVNTMGIDRDIDVACEKCKHEWTSKIEFNPSTFFAPRSSA